MDETVRSLSKGLAVPVSTRAVIEHVSGLPRGRICGADHLPGLSRCANQSKREARIPHECNARPYVYNPPETSAKCRSARMTRESIIPSSTLSPFAQYLPHAWPAKFSELVRNMGATKTYELLHTTDSALVSACAENADDDSTGTSSQMSETSLKRIFNQMLESHRVDGHR